MKKTSNVLQIKQLHFYDIDLNFERCQLIAKSISDDGKLQLWDCKITKPGYEAFSIKLENKHVIQFKERIHCFFQPYHNYIQQHIYIYAKIKPKKP